MAGRLKKRLASLVVSTLTLLTAFTLSATSANYNLNAQESISNVSQIRAVCVEIDSQLVEPSFGTVAGSWFYHAGKESSQALLLGFPKCGKDQSPQYRLYVDLKSGSRVKILLPATRGVISCKARSLGQNPPRIQWNQAQETNAPLQLTNQYQSFSSSQEISITIVAPEFQEKVNADLAPCAVELVDFQIEVDGQTYPLSLEPTRKAQSLKPIETSPDFRPSLEQAMIRWDWQMQDGIGVPVEYRSYAEALAQRLPEGRKLLDELQKALDTESYEALASYDEEIADKFDAFENDLKAYQQLWKAYEDEFANLTTGTSDVEDDKFADLWTRAHGTKREILLNAPYFQFGSLLFMKHAPGVMSHQLTQVYGYCARPGGGVYCLDAPGKSMKTRDVTPANLPLGSYMTPELSFDGKTLYFAYCETPTTPTLWRNPEVLDRRFHIYKSSLNTEGKLEATRLTDGDYDDFAPLLLPDGDLIFCSTRRGGFHRCGSGPCYVYTLARSGGDGSNPHPISFHETNEWFPTLAHNGRVVYTRWDYVDRDAVYYQQLWSTRQDGTDVRITYGNNTLNPPGMWEPQAVPGSEKIMAIAGPHHGLSAGSVVLLDLSKDVDGTEPIERLTPDVRFPEGEAPMPSIPMLPNLCDFDYEPTAYWQATRPAERAEQTPEERRWPVHCFKSPIPLSEKFFIASYSFDKLLGEAGPNIPNQFGIYFCDAFGNRELIYRDPNISSLWALPLRSRPTPPVVASTLDDSRRDMENPTGVFFVQNVYESWPTSIPGKVKSLRIVQVLPKTTPNANQPMVGAANASPGKQVLGVVPVEEDGSAFFEAPAKTPILFQALDEKGRMIQGMRSLVYLQPGEAAGCVGCHENRMATVPSVKTIASTREPSKIVPGPDGSKPLSYPILVQPVLDAKCVSCHGNEKSEGGINLTGEIDGSYTKSYNALMNYVANSYWGAPEGNYEPRTEPLRFGSIAGKLTKILEEGHHNVELTEEEWDRLNVWQDANALFYGTFNVEDQARQQRGERISGPELE